MLEDLEHHGFGIRLGPGPGEGFERIRFGISQSHIFPERLLQFGIVEASGKFQSFVRIGIHQILLRPAEGDLIPGVVLVSPD